MSEQLALEQCFDDRRAFLGMNGPVRPERSWMALAATSLPVPVSPVMKTETLAGATRSIASMIRRIETEWPIMTNPNRPVDS